jgi:hypothetical protein
MKAEDIAAEIVRRLGLDGGETDIHLKVYQGQRLVDRDMVPCTVVIEGDDIPQRLNQRTDYSVEQRYAIAGYERCDPDHPNITGHKVLRDLKRKIFRDADGKPEWRLGFPGGVKEVMYLGRGMGPLAPGESYVIAILEIAVVTVENVANP